MKTYFDFMLARLKFRLIAVPALFLIWHFLAPNSITIAIVIISSIVLIFVYLLAVIFIDYRTNRDTAEKLHVPVEKIYHARYEIGKSTEELLAFGENFQLFIDIEIHNMAVSKLKEEVKDL